MSNILVLPRPGSEFPKKHPIPAPQEQAFTDTFGTLLPKAQYLHHPLGKAAYYTFPPSASSAAQSSTDQKNAPTRPSRVLLIHGVQTPALGLLPLTTALRARFPHTQYALLDLWGHGLSDTPVVPHEGVLFHTLIDAVLVALGWKGERVAVVGFSFGAVLTMGLIAGYAEEEQGKVGVESFVLVAPAGLVRKSWFDDEQRGWLGRECAVRDEERAAEWVVSVLEGGRLNVPVDWQERVGRGEVVAEALRDWQMKRHPGHAASVVGVFRDAGVTDNDELFVRAKATGIPSLVVLGADDDLSTESEIRGFGFDVRVVKEAGHSVVRDKAEEVAEHIAEFWRGL